MTQEEISFINQFQAVVLAPIQKDLIPRKHKNWQEDKVSTTLEEILCSLSILPKSNGEFDLTYLCRCDLFQASYRINESTEHVEHGLWEVRQYMELYKLKPGLLPIGNEINHLIANINKLLQIVNPVEYGEFSKAFM